MLFALPGRDPGFGQDGGTMTTASPLAVIPELDLGVFTVHHVNLSKVRQSADSS